MRLPALALLLLGSLGAARPNLVVVSIDTLRADHVGSYGYQRPTTPHLDRLAADALLFERAVAPMATTLPSHVSLFTGTYPARHGILSNFRFFEKPLEAKEGLHTAAQALASAGYATAAFTSSSPLAAVTGIDAGFETFRGPPAYAERDRRTDVVAAETVDAALAWLAEVEPPFFLWVHLFDPHSPYRAPQPFLGRFAPDHRQQRLVRERGVPEALRTRALTTIDRYDEEIAYADAQVGRLLDALRERELYEKSVIVVVGDHGEGLSQHGVLGHGVIWNEQLFVPLLLRIPDGPRGRRTSLASLVDLLPTLAGSAGLPLPREQAEGIDLLTETRSSALAQREVRKQWPEAQYTLVTLEWKYWHLENGKDRLYDLRRDPHEQKNVIDAYPVVAETMRKELLRIVEESKSGTGLAVEEEIPESMREHLRALGYVE